MILISHIIIALGSVLYTGYVFVSPSKTKLNISYVLLGLTIVTGTYLVISKPAHILQSCVTGLTFVTLMLAGIFAARYKLIKVNNK